MAKTFKNLQDQVLEWMADEGDTGLMLDLVKQAIDKAQRKLLGAEQYDFMLSAPITLTTVSGRQEYVFPSDFLSLLYVQDPDTLDYLEEVPIKSSIEAEDGLIATQGFSRYRIVGMDGVSRQPSVADNIDINTSGGNEAAANGIVIQGLNSAGEYVEETLSSGSTWSTLSSTTSFARVDNIIKTGATWTRTITATTSLETLLTLQASEFVKQYHKLEIIETVLEARSLTYRYYKRPIDLVYDNQLPQVPETYRDILVYGALLALPGFTKAEPDEIALWVREYEELRAGMRQNYQQARSIGSRARRITYVPRV